MYWLFTLMFAVISIVVSFIILTIMYRKHIHPWFEQDTLNTFAFSGMPHCKGYWDLKFSALRHIFVFLITAVVFYYSSTPWLLNVFLYGNSFYTVVTLLRYWNRRAVVKKDVAEGRHNLAETLKKPLKASKVIVFYSICINIAVFILYGIRP